VQWTPVASIAKANAARAAKAKRSLRSSERAQRRPAWQQTALTLLAPGGVRPVATWSIAVIALVSYVVGLVASNAPFIALAAIPGYEWQIWRFFTLSVGSAAGLDLLGILGFLLNLFFLLYAGPQVENALGRSKFLWVFLSTTAVGGVVAVLIFRPVAGLVVPLMAMLGAAAVIVWHVVALRVQVLLLLAVNLVLSLAYSTFVFPSVVAALAAGVGTTILFRRHETGRLPYLVIAGGVAGLIAIAILVGFLR